MSTPQLTTTFLCATRPPTTDVHPRRRSTCAARLSHRPLAVSHATHPARPLPPRVSLRGSTRAAHPRAPLVSVAALHLPRAPVSTARSASPRVHPCCAPHSAACQHSVSPRRRFTRAAFGPVPTQRVRQCCPLAALSVCSCRACRYCPLVVPHVHLRRSLAESPIHPAHLLVLPRPSKGVIGLPIRFVPRSTRAGDAGVSTDAARSSGERAVLRGHAPRNPPPPRRGSPRFQVYPRGTTKTAGQRRPRSTQNGPRRPGGRRGPRWWRRQAFSVG